MSSKPASKGKKTPRLSVAMDTDVVAAEEFQPPQVAEGSGVDAPVAEPAPRKVASRGARRSESVGVEGDVREIDGELYVRSGRLWKPAGDRVQMTIAVTAMERLRWEKYAAARNIALIDVMRDRMRDIFEGEEE